MAYCEEYVEFISAAIDGALSPAEQEKLSAHLASCPECQKLYDDLSALHAATAELPPVEVPAGLKGRIMDAVAAEAEEAKALPFAPKKSPIRWQRWLASAAVLALVVLGTWSWKPWESHSSADLPQAAEAGAVDRGRWADTTEAQPVAPAAVPEPASAPAESAPTVTPKLASAFTAGDAASVPENATADAPAEASLTTEATGPLDYEPMAKVAPAAGAALPSEAPVVYGYSFNGSGDAETGSAASALEENAPLALESIAMPRLYSIAPTAQSVPSPAEEGALEQSVTSQAEAVRVLANYIYEFVGDVELVEDNLAVNYTVNSPTGVSGIITCAGEDGDAYFLDYKDDLSPDVLHYSVNKQTSQVTLLEQVD